MHCTIEARIEPDGTVRLFEQVELTSARRALVTILDEMPQIASTTPLSDDALAEGWSRPEEDTACSFLQPQW